MPRNSGRLFAIHSAAFLALATLSAVPVSAQESEAQAIQSEPGKAPAALPADPSILRVCASESQPPLSMKDGSGSREPHRLRRGRGHGAQGAVRLVRRRPRSTSCATASTRSCATWWSASTATTRACSTTKPYYRSRLRLHHPRRPGPRHQVLVRSAPEDPSTTWSSRFGTPGEAMLKDIGRYEEDMAYLYSLVNFRAAAQPPTRRSIRPGWSAKS